MVRHAGWDGSVIMSGPRETKLLATAEELGAFHDLHRIHSGKKWEEIVHDPGPIERLRCVSYVSSPDLVLEFFEEHDVDSLELIYGDHRNDYRQALVGHPEVADKLEQLKEDGRLVVWTAQNKTLHTKMYEILYRDGSLRLLLGSPNLTNSAVNGQVNMVAEFRTEPGSEFHEAWIDHYEAHKDLSKRFLDDLTEIINESEEERRDVIERWVEGRTSREPPKLEAARAVVEAVREETDPFTNGHSENTTVEVSMKGHPEDAREFVRDSYGGRILDDTFRVDASQFGQAVTETYNLPHVGLNNDKGVLVFYMPNGRVETIGKAPPPDDPAPIDEALGHIEAFIETVDEYAITDRPQHVKAHMMEALLYVMWSPFASWTANLYRHKGIENTKRLPFLYIWGEASAGKDTLAKYAYQLISPDSWEPNLVDGGRLTNRYIRGLRYASTVYPAVLSDVQKDKIRRAEVLRNYWEERPEGMDAPALIMTTNDSRPGDWFQERAKILTFDCQFSGGIEGDRYINELLEEPNPLYDWVVHEYTRKRIELDDDPLYAVREILQDFYEQAGRELPDYFPTAPAEEMFSLDRLEIRELQRHGLWDIHEEEGNRVIEFAEDVEPWEVHQMERKIPHRCRSSKQGRKIVIKNPEAFEAWYRTAGDEEGGFIDRVRSLFGGQ